MVCLIYGVPDGVPGRELQVGWTAKQTTLLPSDGNTLRIIASNYCQSRPTDYISAFLPNDSLILRDPHLVPVHLVFFFSSPLYSIFYLLTLRTASPPPSLSVLPASAPSVLIWDPLPPFRTHHLVLVHPYLTFSTPYSTLFFFFRPT